MTLRLLRFDPCPQRAGAWMASEDLRPRDRPGFDEGYAWHALLAAAFGARAPRPFRVIARRGRPPRLLAYTQTPLADLRDHAAAFADALAIAALRPDLAAEKPMPAFAAGRRLGFEVRIRPTIRRDRDGDRTRTAELDAYVAAREAAAPDAAPDRADVYAAWLAERLRAGGASMARAHPIELRRQRLLRRGRSGPGGTRDLLGVEGHSATFAGTLEVVDASAFAALLARGVGRHRAFGFGMLLLRPPEG